MVASYIPVHLPVESNTFHATICCVRNTVPVLIYGVVIVNRHCTGHGVGCKHARCVDWYVYSPDTVLDRSAILAEVHSAPLPTSAFHFADDDVDLTVRPERPNVQWGNETTHKECIANFGAQRLAGNALKCSVDVFARCATSPS